MDPRKVLGPAAEMVKLVVLVPTRITLDRALEESEKTGLPVPVTESDVLAFTAFDETSTEPAIFPVAEGLKLTLMVHVWFTFNDAGTVGKLVPQLFVSAKPNGAVMLVMVTASLPLLMRRAVWFALVVPTVCAANVSEAGEKSKDPPVRTPSPVTVIACDPPALSVMVI
jgi:hypothetical protein